MVIPLFALRADSSGFSNGHKFAGGAVDTGGLDGQRICGPRFAWKTELFTLFVLVPSCGAFGAASFNIEHVCVSSYWALGAILFGGKIS